MSVGSIAHNLLIVLEYKVRVKIVQNTRTSYAVYLVHKPNGRTLDLYHCQGTVQRWAHYKASLLKYHGTDIYVGTCMQPEEFM